MHPFSGFEDEKLDSFVLPDGSKLDDKKKAEWRRRRDTLANLHLLKERENECKNAAFFVDCWQ